MRMQDRIIQRQNSDDMLRCQYAARYYFNRGEKILAAVVILSIINVLFASFPETDNACLQWVVRIVPIVLNMCTVFLIVWLNRTVQNAAELRNYYDESVLSINAHSFNYDIRSLRTLIDRAIRKNEKEAHTQIINNTHANPPGVRDWYNFAKEYSDEEVVFECQRQNQWWTTKMLYQRLAITACFSILLAVSITLCLYSKTNNLHAVICFFGTFVAFLDRIIVNVKYILLSVKIGHFCENMDNDRTSKQIQQLQELIASRRRIPVLEMNAIHKRKASTFSDQYKSITKE